MKIIKPLDIGLMYRVYEINQRCYLVSTAIAYFSFDAPEKLESELQLWPMVAEELGAEGVLDAGMPKVGAEYLVCGKIFPDQSRSPVAGTVKVTVADRQKELNVFGDRQWKKNSLNNWQLSDPQTLSELDLSYRYAFGGEEFPENPAGKGYVHNLEQYDGYSIDVPNIVSSDQPLAAPDQTMIPAGYSPYEFTWPQRYAKIGTYDEKWLKNDFPGFAEDFDPTFLNIAPGDQQFPNKFRGDEAFSCENMHPDKRLLRSKLPGIRVRCFVNKGEDESVDLDEIGMQADTLWLFPHRERGVLLFHGQIEVTDDDASQYRQMIIAYENISDEPRDAAHYTHSMIRRLDKKNGHLQAFNEKDIIAEGADSALGQMLKDSMTGINESILAKNLKKRSDSEIEAAWKRLEDIGLDPADYKTNEGDEYPEIDCDNLDQLEGLVAQISEDGKKHRENMEKMARDAAESMGQDYDAMLEAAKKQQTGPVHFSADKIIKQLHKYNLGDAKKEEKLRKIEKEVDRITRQYGHFFDQPARASKEARETMRQDILQARESGTSVAGGEYPGVDLSGLDLCGMDLSGCFFDGAKLSGTDFSEADLSGAMLARADLSGARFDNTKMSETNFGKAFLDGARFQACSMNKAVLYQASLEGTSFTNVHMAGADFTECKGRGADFSGSDLTDTIFMESNLDESNFAGCDMSKAFFYKTSARQAIFSGAVCRETVLVQFNGDGSDFSGADMENLRTAMETSLKKSNFSRSNLKDANLREVDFSQSDFTECILSGADLSKSNLRHSTFYRSTAVQTMFIQADLRESRMVSINLMEGSLQKANLEKCDLRGANLFAANLMQIDFSTVLLDQANTGKTLLSSGISQ